MSRIGLILACDHYPAVTDRVCDIDAQLRHWLSRIGLPVSEVSVFHADRGELPRHAGAFDAWIVSGPFLLPEAVSSDRLGDLRMFLRASVALGRTLLAVHHAEHILHDAVAAIDAPAPETPENARCIRNPFRSFHSGDLLFRFNPGTRRVEALERPSGITTRRMFEAVRLAA